MQNLFGLLILFNRLMFVAVEVKSKLCKKQSIMMHARILRRSNFTICDISLSVSVVNVLRSKILLSVVIS